MEEVLNGYLKEQFQWKKLWLGYLKESDFYLCPWLRTSSLIPLLIFRLLLFVCSMTLMFLSICAYIEEKKIQFWCIFLTHWALVTLILAIAFSVFVSAMFYLFRPPIVIVMESGDDDDAQHCLPWYVKVYWVLYNIATPMAFFITVFYWTMLYKGGKGPALEERRLTVNISVHALNSVVMLLLLVTSSQPYRLSHAWHALLFGAVFLVFSFFYQLAGGLNPQGKPYIYSLLNWERPDVTGAMALSAGVGIMLLQGLAFALAAGRDAIASALKLGGTDEDDDYYAAV